MGLEGIGERGCTRGLEGRGERRGPARRGVMVEEGRGGGENIRGRSPSCPVLSSSNSACSSQCKHGRAQARAALRRHMADLPLAHPPPTTPRTRLPSWRCARTPLPPFSDRHQAAGQHTNANQVRRQRHTASRVWPMDASRDTDKAGPAAHVPQRASAGSRMACTLPLGALLSCGGCGCRAAHDL